MNIDIRIPDREPTLADLIKALAGNDRLSATRRRDLISAVNTTARLANRRPEEIAANARDLRERLARLHLTHVNMKPKRLANIKSDLAAALKHVPVGAKVHIRDAGLSPRWKAFRESLETDWQRYTLARLARYCSAHRIPPERVSDELIGRFREHLDQTQIAKNPGKVVKITIQTWNGFVTRSGADLPLLAKPASTRFITRPLTDYPKSFRDDIEAWIERLSSNNHWAADGPGEPLKPATIKNIRASIRQFAHALVESEHPIEGITGLSTLVDLRNLRAGLDCLILRNGGEYPVGLLGMVAKLLALARYYVKAPTEQTDTIRDMKTRLKKRLTRAGKANRSGLTAKNKERLAQFDDARNIGDLIRLPENLLNHARASECPSSRVALTVMYAVAIELLLACPIRVGNLAQLNVEAHFRWYGQGRGKRLAIVIPGTEVERRGNRDRPAIGEHAAREGLSRGLALSGFG